MSIKVHMINSGHGESILLGFEKQYKDSNGFEDGNSSIEAMQKLPYFNRCG